MRRVKDLCSGLRVLRLRVECATLLEIRSLLLLPGIRVQLTHPPSTGQWLLRPDAHDDGDDDEDEGHS